MAENKIQIAELLKTAIIRYNVILLPKLLTKSLKDVRVRYYGSDYETVMS